MHSYPGLTLVSGPEEEPITLAEAKLAARIDLDDDDTLLDGLIAAARAIVEDETHRQLVTATYDLTLDRFPIGRQPIFLPRAPLQSVASLKYLDTAGTLQTWSTDNYLVHVDHEPGRIVPAYGLTWPAARRIEASVRIRFTAGYGTAHDVPPLIKAAIKLLVADRYEHREEVTSENLRQLPNGAERIMRQLCYGDEFTDYAETL